MCRSHLTSVKDSHGMTFVLWRHSNNFDWLIWLTFAFEAFVHVIHEHVIMLG
jgi:hypothetical protein